MCVCVHDQIFEKRPLKHIKPGCPYLGVQGIYRSDILQKLLFPADHISIQK